MNDEDFMNELQELTKNMSKEFSQVQSQSHASVKAPSTSNNINLGQGNINDFGMNFGGSEENYMKEIEKMLGGFSGLGGLENGMDLNLDESDPQTKEMMKLLSKLKYLNNSLFLFF